MSYIYNLTDTWNSAGTTFNAIKMNVTDTASAAGSLLMDLQVGGSSKFSVLKNGTFTAQFGQISPTSINGLEFNYTRAGISLGSTAPLNWTDGQPGAGTMDLQLRRDAANTLAQRNGVNAQTFRTYNTYTDVSNYERIGIYYDGSGTNRIWMERAGTGSPRNLSIGGDAVTLQFGVGATVRWQINSSGHFLANTDNAYDIGASGATRPRNLYLGGGIFANAAFVLTGNPGGGGATSRYISGAGTTTDWYFNVPTGGTHYFATAEVQRWQINVSGHFLAGADNTYDIGASGANRPRALYVATNGTFGGYVNSQGYQFLFSDRGNISAQADGVFRLQNNVGTDFGRLQFGGTTSSFPSLKRNATALETKLADDSAYAPHAMQYLDVTDGVAAPAAATGRARIYVDTADGDLKIIFADGTIKTIVTDT